MDYLASLRCFVRAVDLGSFSKAAQERGIKVSTVSRAVAALETDLGAALLDRSTHRIALTQTGGSFYEDAVRILGEVEEARDRATSSNATPQGRLRVTIPSAFGRLHVMPHLPAFMEAYPMISLEIDVADAHLDLIEAGMDVAIRIGALPDSAMVARKLAPQRRVLYASPTFIENADPIQRPEDLASRPALIFALHPKRTWYFEHPRTHERVAVDISGRLVANDKAALLTCARAGFGIALLPTWAAYGSLDDGTLQVVLADWTAAIAPGIEQDIWAIYPPKKIVAPKVRAFIAFLEERFRAPPYWERKG